MSKSIQGAQSFARNMNVLQQIADAGTPPSRAELMQHCGLTRPTLYRIVASLEAEGLIATTKDNRYTLGGRLVMLARKALAQNDIREIAGSPLMHLRDTTGETVHLAIRSGDDLIYIDKFESREVVRMASTIGTRVTFSSSGVGKAFLSALPVSEAESLIAKMSIHKITPFTTIDHSAMKDIVSQTRVAGFVCDNQENEIGIVCFGAAICEGTDRPVASVSVSVPLFRLHEDISRYSVPLLEAVAVISAKLGFVR